MVNDLLATIAVLSKKIYFESSVQKKSDDSKYAVFGQNSTKIENFQCLKINEKLLNLHQSGSVLWDGEHIFAIKDGYSIVKFNGKKGSTNFGQVEGTYQSNQFLENIFLETDQETNESKL